MGKKLLLVQPLGPDLSHAGNAKVVVDTVGAGAGELVLLVTGAASRNAVRRPEAALDSAAVGIVDSVEADERYIFEQKK